jgi:hypothetical protein
MFSPTYIFVNCNWVATRWQLYSTHLHTNNTQNDTKQTIHRTTQKWESAGRAPSHANKIHRIILKCILFFIYLFLDLINTLKMEHIFIFNIHDIVWRLGNLKFKIIILGKATCFDRGAHPLAIQLLKTVTACIKRLNLSRHVSSYLLFRK